jgi:nitroreductase
MSHVQLEAQPLIDAIAVRRSVRNYRPDPLPVDSVARIATFIENLKVPFDHATEALIYQAEPDSGLYNNGSNPVDNIAFLSQTDLVSTSKTGFVGELVMLYTVSLGLDTCWYGHYVLGEVGRYIEDITTPEMLAESDNGIGYGWHTDVGRRVVVSMPFGLKDEQADAMMLAARGPRPRLELVELLEDPTLITAIPSDIVSVLDLGRKAPSGGNGQMWRFGVDLDFGVITVAKPHGYVHPR